MISQSNKQAFRNPWVIGWVAMVTIVFGVNVYMVAQAFVANPGLVNKDYYEQGRDLEKNIRTRKAAREALGWNVNVEPGELYLRKPGIFRVAATDRNGKPLAGATAVLYAYRPSDAAADFELPLKETAPGQYASEAVFPLKGAWDLVVEVRQGENRFEVARRVSVFAN